MDFVTQGLQSLFYLILFNGVSFARVTQTDTLWRSEGDEATMHCRQTHGSSYYQMYWYRQRPGENMRQVVFTMSSQDKPDFEPDFKNTRFEATKPNAENGTLTVGDLQPGDSGLYFCAVSEGQDNLNEAFFGAGTKLTVLEKDHEITPPRVKLFPPSSKERPRRKGDTRFKTLVCLAQDFYPDHVEVFWEVNREAIKERVSTDTAAQRKGKTYSISSRLVVPAEDWTNRENCFSCIVSFYNGISTNNYTEDVCGNEGDAQKDGGRSREKYLRTTQNAKLSYTVLIVKSGVYGLFVAFLVWKIQRADRKQT